MITLLANWRLFAAVGLIGIGWYGHTVWDGYHSQNAEIKAVDSLGKGEASILDFNQKIFKDKASEKDNCLERPLSAATRQLLQ